MRLILFLFLSVSMFGAFPNGYAYRRPITIQASQITGTLTDFPVLVSGTYTYLKDTGNGGLVTSSSGYDYIFTASDGTTNLKFERERYVNTTGEVISWVKVPSAAVGTVIYEYYGNSSVTTDQSDAPNVWNSNYKHVWHITDGSTLSGLDSVSGGQTMTGNAGTPTAGVGQVDGGVVLNGTTQSMRTSAFTLSTTPNVFTISAWVKVTDLNRRNNIFTTTVSGAAQRWWIEVGNLTNTGSVAIAYQGLGVFISNSLSYPSGGAWHHVAFTRNGTGNTGLIYIDGVSVTVNYTADAGFLDSSSEIRAIGERAASQYFGGTIDEVKYSDSVRSADWINAEFKNQSAPGTFYAVGSQETAGRNRALFPYR